MRTVQLLYSWIIVALFGSSLVLLAPAGAGAQVQIFEHDHLKCYQARDSNKAGRHAVELFNSQFLGEKCKVSNKASYLCAPTIKVSVDGVIKGDDPRGDAIDQITDDYLCYKLKCENPVERDVLVNDQFGERRLKIKPARLLCTPVRKIEPQPISCQQSGPPVCGGQCDPGLVCRQPTPTAGCECLQP
jgi:hypothetical protein